MQFTDAVAVAGTRRLADAYLVAEAKCGRSCAPTGCRPTPTGFLKRAYLRMELTCRQSDTHAGKRCRQRADVVDRLRHPLEPVKRACNNGHECRVESTCDAGGSPTDRYLHLPSTTPECRRHIDPRVVDGGFAAGAPSA